MVGWPTITEKLLFRKVTFIILMVFFGGSLFQFYSRKSLPAARRGMKRRNRGFSHSLVANLIPSNNPFTLLAPTYKCNCRLQGFLYGLRTLLLAKTIDYFSKLKDNEMLETS